MTVLGHPLRGRATSIQPHLPGATLESLHLTILTIATTGDWVRCPHPCIKACAPCLALAKALMALVIHSCNTHPTHLRHRDHGALRCEGPGMQRFQQQVLDQTPTLVSCADDHSMSTIEEVIPRPGGVYLNSCRETDDHRISAGEAEFSP
ncbi:hypothetical protein SCLCIDRAFT_24363 [Scleroderma citrinum Foug A]|uniref:Uncharacterized protein n=1 Tax=Scleroderma citrinum Foug A TaxID=1036808 RepID=A0A0C3AE69_9AGAM|nr:hypothetical protein SCLCIDRAFT_24363 [Scleroderma citrinum Foug A]